MSQSRRKLTSTERTALLLLVALLVVLVGAMAWQRRALPEAPSGEAPAIMTPAGADSAVRVATDTIGHPKSRSKRKPAAPAGSGPSLDDVRN